MKIRKHSGELAQFDAGKLKRSLLRSGAGESLIEDIVSEVSGQLYPHMTTKQIYKIAFRMLREKSAASAARYNLREAIRLLGPAGFYFEKYIARIFADHGFDTRTNLMLPGRCVTHEIDVAMRMGESVGIVECKFHSGRDTASDVKVPMYILSRFNDLAGIAHRIFTDDDLITSCIIATNNRFTADAIAFARCSGLELVSWDHPSGKSLKDLNDGRNLYPVTAMTTITMDEKDFLLKNNIVLARELPGNQQLLETLGISAARMVKIMNEASALKHGTK